MTGPEWVGLGYDEQLPPEWATPFRESLASVGLDVEVRSQPGPRVMAGIEWLMPTIAAVIVTPLVSGFLQEAGADAYHTLRDSTAHLGTQLLGKAHTISALGLKHSEYSPAFSFVVLLDEGWQLKVLLRDGYQEPQLTRIFELLFEVLILLDRGDEVQLLTGLSASGCPGRKILVDYDEALDCLRVVDPISTIRRGEP